MKPLTEFIVLLVLSLLLIVPSFAAQEIGSISEVTGGVDILRGGKLPAESARVGEKVAQGDIIRTKSGGKVQVQFKDDSLLTIAPDSRVALNEYVYEPEKNQRQASIKIFQGLVHTVVNKVFKKEAPDFTVETQTAVIGVRGTDYYTLVAPALSDIYNNSGTTEVRNIFAEVPGKVKLQGKEFTQVSRNLPPTLPLPLTQDDINWIKGQMVPKVAAKPTGTGTVSSQNQLLGKVSGSAVETQNVSNSNGMPGQPNVIQNTQSAIFVPPQPTLPVTPVTPPLPVPFNIYIAWGSGAQDLDLYLSGPAGTTSYLNRGNSNSPTYYHLDSAVPNGSEVITVRNWTTGGTYVAYVQDYTNRKIPSSTVLSSSSQVSMQLYQGGTVAIQPVGVGSKAVVNNGTPVLSSPLSIPTSQAGQPGNNWTAVSLNPTAGTITPINTIGPYVPPVTITPTPPTPPAQTVVPSTHTTTTTTPGR